LRAQVVKLGIADCVTFIGAVPNTETYRYYRSHEIFVNCSKSGMFDKTIFKAIACGCLVLATSHDFADLAGEEFTFANGDGEALAKKLNKFLFLPDEKHRVCIETLTNIIKSHRLPVLVESLVKEIRV